MLPNIISSVDQRRPCEPAYRPASNTVVGPYQLTRRIVVNIYIETPPLDSGGEIDFWHRFTDEGLYMPMKRSTYGLHRDGLGEPHLSIHPDQGDLDVRRCTSARRPRPAAAPG